VRVGQRLGGEHVQLLPLRREWCQEVRIAHRPERVRAPPPAERRVEDRRRRAVRATGEGLPAAGHIVDEPVGVDGDDLPVDQVPPGPPRDRIAAQQPPQPGDVGVHGRHRRVDGPLTPDVVHDLLGRYGLVRPRQDAREHRLLPRATQSDWLITHSDGEIAEHVQHDTLVPRARAVGHRCRHPFRGVGLLGGSVAAPASPRQ
jgi:hypothetical protein